jgi:hypothetical protein
VASMWLNVVGCVRIESWVRINRVCQIKLFSPQVYKKSQLLGNLLKGELNKYSNHYVYTVRPYPNDNMQ